MCRRTPDNEFNENKFISYRLHRFCIGMMLPGLYDEGHHGMNEFLRWVARDVPGCGAYKSAENCMQQDAARQLSHLEERRTLVKYE